MNNNILKLLLWTVLEKMDLGILDSQQGFWLSFRDLSLNKLSGGLPSNLSSNLVTVNFGHNYLTGSIPDSYGSLQQLQALQLANNFLNGTIPASLGSGLSFSNNSNTLLVDLQNNNLTGLDTELLFEATRSTNINVW
jgi:hypothetical protein